MLNLNLQEAIRTFFSLFTGFNATAAFGKRENWAEINCINAQVAVIKCLIGLDEIGRLLFSPLTPA